jgi:hypothetical protein
MTLPINFQFEHHLRRLTLYTRLFQPCGHRIAGTINMQMYAKENVLSI